MSQLPNLQDQPPPPLPMMLPLQQEKPYPLPVYDRLPYSAMGPRMVQPPFYQPEMGRAPYVVGQPPQSLSMQAQTHQAQNLQTPNLQPQIHQAHQNPALPPQTNTPLLGQLHPAPHYEPARSHSSDNLRLPSQYSEHDAKRQKRVKHEAREPMLAPPLVPVSGGSPAQKPKNGQPRKRSQTACDTCRQKKIKCDNVRPKCGACLRNGASFCNYSLDDQNQKNFMLDLAYYGIVSKLDTIMNELRRAPVADSAARQTPAPKPQRSQPWDLSLTSILKWPFLQEVLRTNDEDVARHTLRLLEDYEETNLHPQSASRVLDLVDLASAAESLLYAQIFSHVNLFLVHCHTKVPLLDTIVLIELLEMFSALRKASELVSFTMLLQEFYNLPSHEPVGATYLAAVQAGEVTDGAIQRRAYRALCENALIIIMICAVGAISTPVSLDNIGTYETSLEERSSLPQDAESDRLSVSQMFVSYANMLAAIFPKALRANLLASVTYHVFYSQYFQYTMNPMLAFEEISNACKQLIFHLEKARLQNTQPVHTSLSDDPSFVNRLFWTCLKLECELRTELSPYVPLSGICDISPPSQFLKLPEPPREDKHTKESVRIAARYDDEYPWYFYLTEVAVRKVDNDMLDELYSDPRGHLSWSNSEFMEKKLWKLTIKYMSQLNGIVDLLTPQIRKFVISEANVEQIYSSIKRKAERKRSRSGETDILETLDDFLIDEDLLIKAQSESVMFIKTRILLLKLALVRPLIYMFLHDGVSFMDLIEAASEILARTKMTQSEQDIIQNSEDSHSHFSTTNTESESSGYTTTVASNFLGEQAESFEMKDSAVPQLSSFEKKFRIDDFTDLFEYGSDDDIVVKDYDAARKRILKMFVGGFVTMPKLNIPKIGLYRHPGSWYYVRNLFIGVVSQFLVYKKVQQYVIAMTSASAVLQKLLPAAELMDALGAIFRKDSIKDMLEHALLIVNYWRDERKDCGVLREYLEKCLSAL